jgi:hypothetical protein
MVTFLRARGKQASSPYDSFREFRGLVHDFNNRTMRLSKLNSLMRHGHYDPSNLGAALQALYGDAKLRDSLRTLIIPTYNIDGGQMQVATERNDTPDSPVHTQNNVTDRGGHALWMKNVRTGHPPGTHNLTIDVSLYDAVMASTAAPTYFPVITSRRAFPASNRLSSRASMGASSITPVSAIWVQSVNISLQTASLI